MDATHEIKLRLPIDRLVSEYCQVHKKGKQLKCLCPFHNDKHPSMLISPEKGIAYCFACNSGGDIFSFYQKIEGVEFPQALKDLAEKAGVTLENTPVQKGPTADEKTRLKECIKAAATLFEQKLQTSDVAKDYLQKRGIDAATTKQFGIGYSPDSFSEVHQALLKQGFSKSEITKAGLAAERDMNGELYDRFRNRLMFPIWDTKGEVIAFGGRTLGDDKAKYINSPEGPLYNKSQVLYGYHLARDAMRSGESVVLVEGYFDVIACHRAGIQNVVAVSGTALTEQHVALLKRLVKTVTLCLDQDDAGKTAALRSFELCSAEELEVRTATITGKDPDEALAENKDQFVADLTKNHLPFIEAKLQELAEVDGKTIDGKKQILATILPLVKQLHSAVERNYYLDLLATKVHTSLSALESDLANLTSAQPTVTVAATQQNNPQKAEFNRVDLALGTFLLFPAFKHLLPQLIEPVDPFHKALYQAILQAESEEFTVESLELEPEYTERATIISLYCESLDWLSWSDLLIAMNIKKQCQFANQWLLKQKISEATSALNKAKVEGREADVLQLQTTINKELKLRKNAEG